MNRSYLFIPGDVPRMVQTLDVFESDAVILDFEDAVAYQQKDEARYLTKSFLKTFSFKSPDIYIRINAHTDKALFEADLEIIKTLNIKGIMLPKTSLAALDAFTRYMKNEKTLEVIGLIETPESFFELQEIAKHEVISALCLGAEDLSKTLSLKRTTSGDEILYARSQIVFAAKSYHKLAIDTPFVAIHDFDGLKQDCLKASQLGFDGKAAIHPNHVDLINQIFSPSEDEILEAKRIIKASEKLNTTRFSLDGKMVDKPIIDRAKALIDKASRIK
ncbi:MAG: HpcH/HpaI aldolase/citrate lyase family protein [Candidatus Izemoplasmataceae bacterium]